MGSPRCRSADHDLCLQVRAGTGGDEAALWVSELVRMYQRYAEQQQWKLSFISSTEADKGGYRECIVQVTSRCLCQQLSQCQCRPASRLWCSQSHCIMACYLPGEGRGKGRDLSSLNIKSEVSF